MNEKNMEILENGINSVLNPKENESQQFFTHKTKPGNKFKFNIKNSLTLKVIKKYYKLLLCIFSIITFVIKERENKEERIIRDVLYISGIKNKDLPQAYRYRVLHQLEQLDSGYLEATSVYHFDLDPSIVSDFRVIIFYRCHWTKKVEDSIILAKELNKKVLFDIDDLIIDLKYTNLISYIQNLSAKEKQEYDEGVILIGKTLKLCEGAITTTEVLARELNKYVPEVFINRNVASEQMFELSEHALKEKKVNKNEIIIGYLSGSITHNEDILILIPALKKILKEFKNVKILIVGFLDIPKDLQIFSSRIIEKPFVDWKQLPKIISSIDINLAPLNRHIFNEAKSEIKWVEAALVKVPTIASDFGAFKQTIQHGKTGLLCEKSEDWYNEIKSLITNDSLKNYISENAYNYCKENYNSVRTGYKLANYINSVAKKHIGFIVPSLEVSGGVRVILKHALFLKEAGWDVDIISPVTDKNILILDGEKINVIGYNNAKILSQYNIIVGTLYATLYKAITYYKAERIIYLVQSYETLLTGYNNYHRIEAERTYNIPFGIEYITISKWCEDWLKKKYNKKVKYAPNGIDSGQFLEHKRNLNKERILILVEGNPNSEYKNIDESFKIIEKLDEKKFEIWFMSYEGTPKKWYRVDNFLHKIPFEKVPQIYSACDILLKTSYLESFSYPPLEMMATGGYSIVRPNEGNIEYLKDGENCLFYKPDDIYSAVRAIERLISDQSLQDRLYLNGLNTAKEHDWKNYKKQIISLYE